MNSAPFPPKALTRGLAAITLALAGAGPAAAAFQLQVPVNSATVAAVVPQVVTPPAGPAGFWVVTAGMEYADAGHANGSAFVLDGGYQTACPAGGQTINTALAPANDLVFANNTHENWSSQGSAFTSPVLVDFQDVYCIPADAADYDANVFAAAGATAGKLDMDWGSDDRDPLSVIVSAPYVWDSYGGYIPASAMAAINLPIGGKTYTVVSRRVNDAYLYLEGHNPSYSPGTTWYGLYQGVKTGVGDASVQTVMTITPGVLYGTASSFATFTPLPADAQVTMTYKGMP